MLFFNSHAPGVDFLTPLIAGEDLKFIYPCRYIAWCEEDKVWCRAPGFSVLDAQSYSERDSQFVGPNRILEINEDESLIFDLSHQIEF